MRSELSWAAAAGAGLGLSTERGAEAREKLGIRARAAGGRPGLHQEQNVGLAQRRR